MSDAVLVGACYLVVGHIVAFLWMVLAFSDGRLDAHWKIAAWATWIVLLWPIAATMRVAAEAAEMLGAHGPSRRP